LASVIPAEPVPEAKSQKTFQMLAIQRKLWQYKEIERHKKFLSLLNGK